MENDVEKVSVTDFGDDANGSLTGTEGVGTENENDSHGLWSLRLELRDQPLRTP